jgi:anti-sigma regulatory factor (Ser/Thr protein kinase)
MTGRQGRRAKGTVVLEAGLSSILRFEDFVDALAFLSPGERNRLKLAGGEILDNIVKHASPVDFGRIRARASLRGSTILLGFYFRAPGFAAFAGENGPESAFSEPLFDPARRRWRGIGLLMCRNLARRVAFRPGESMDRIFLEFEAEK